MDIENKLRAILKEIDESIDADSLTRESTLKGDLDLTSVALLYLAVAVEDEFGVNLADQDLSKLVTVGDVIALLEK